MKHLTAAFLLASVVPAIAADVRVKINLGAGHPINRPGRTVIVRPPRPGLVVAPPRVAYAPPVVWRRTVVAPPPRQRLVWQDSERMRRQEDWVDSSLAVNESGNQLFLRISGRAQVDFAEVHFRNGQTQVVDFRDNVVMQPGTYSLLDFKDGRYVTHVRMVAKAHSREATVAVLMAR